MVPATSIDARAAAVATKQFGVLSRAQLLEIGVSRTMIAGRLRTGQLHRIHAGVYAVGHAALSLDGRRFSALLAGGPASTLSHLTAAELWNISRIKPQAVDLLVCGSQRPLDGVRLHRTRQLPRTEVTTRDRFRRTTVSRTIVDLVSVLTPWQLTHVLNEAAFRRRLRIDTVEHLGRRMSARPGHRTLVRALGFHALGSAGTKSFSEDEFLRIILAAGIPEPLVNVHVPFGDNRYELDFHWPDLHVNCEVDGSGHEVPKRSKEDVRRDEVMLAHGWSFKRIPASLIHDHPEFVVSKVRGVLHQASQRRRM